MTRSSLLFAASSLLNYGRALSDSPSITASAPSTFEQYCFPRSGGPFSADSIWPSVTMIYSGITLTTTPITVTMSDAISTIAPVASISSLGRNRTDTSRNGWATSTQALSTALMGGGLGHNASGSYHASTAHSRSSMMTGMSSTSSFDSVPIQTAGGTNFSSMEQKEGSASADLSLPTGLSSAPMFNNGNATIALSPPAVDALQLAQFMKNLGVSVFNASRLDATRLTRKGDDASILAKLISDISVQEQTQLKTLRDLLRRSGGQDVPTCRYLLPSNPTELVLLMGALKSVELGAFMSLAELLSPSDTSASMLLSSIASVAAKQNALLHSYTNRNVSIEPFATPSSGTWAYNVALGFVQPGSCALELPLPILPMLTMNNKTAGYAHPGANAIFGWDVAGRSSASRSGKPLFIAWVNQVDLPVFTSLTTLGDGIGTTRVPLGLSGTAFAVLTAQPGLTTIDELTDATLAGPVVVSLQL